MKGKTTRKKSDFAHDVFKMASAPLFTQVASIIVMPLVTRLYGAEAFGLMALFFSISDPITVFATMGYSTAIMLTKNDEDASNVLAVSLFFTVVVSLISIIAVFPLQGAICDLMKAQKLEPYVWLIPVAVFFSGLYMSLRFWNMRKCRFGYVAAGAISRFLANNGLILVSGYSGHAGWLSLVLGTILGGLVNCYVLSRKMLWETRQFFISNVRWHRMVECIKRYRKFPGIFLWTDFLGRFSGQVPIYLLAAFFSQPIVGYYSLGLRLLRMPMSLIGNSVGEVYFQRAATQKAFDVVLLAKLFKNLVLFGLIPMSLLALLGRDVFAFVLGENWAEAGVYAQILSFQIFIQFVTGPAGYLMLIFEKQEASLFLKVAETLVSVVSISLGGLYKSVYLSFILLSFLSGLLYAGYGFYFMKLGGLRLSAIFKILLKHLIIASPLLGVIGLGKWFFQISEGWLIFLSIFGTIMFYGVTLRRNEEIRLLGVGILRKMGFLK